MKYKLIKKPMKDGEKINKKKRKCNVLSIK